MIREMNFVYYLGAMVEINIILSSGWIVVAAKAVRDMNQMRMSERKKIWENVLILKNY